MTSVNSIAQQLDSAIDTLHEVVEGFNLPFTTHAFIQAFSHVNETMYLSFLARYQRPKGVRSVNSQIGRFLSIRCNELRIQKVTREKDGNFFGKNTGNQQWERL